MLFTFIMFMHREKNANQWVMGQDCIATLHTISKKQGSEIIRCTLAMQKVCSVQEISDTHKFEGKDKYQLW